MPAITVAERLLYSTVKIIASKDGVPFSTGTGFFMNLGRKDVGIIPAIVTNNHVVEKADMITVMCHLSDQGKPSGKFVKCSVVINSEECIKHPDSSIDLCAIAFGNILDQAQRAGTPIFIDGLALDLIPSEEDWQYFDAIEDVTMIGCPNGISDSVNNLPIVRRGITASPLSKKYEGREEFMVDMACFPGSSGSPVLIYNRNGFFDRRSGQHNIVGQRLIFVGILYAGPQVANDGQIILGKFPRVMVSAPMHLGNVIRSSALHAIVEKVQERVSNISTPKTTIGGTLDID